MRYKVVGPPGTGKTRRLLNEVQRYVDKGVPLKKIGYSIVINPEIKVGHEKTIVYIDNS